MTNHDMHSCAILLALVIFAGGFPLFLGLLVGSLPKVSPLFRGDHRAWSRFWGTTVAIEWLVTAVVLGCLFSTGIAPSAVGLIPPQMTATWVSLAGAAVIVLQSLMRRSTPLSEAAATPATAILPQTRTERLAWLLVISPTAAVCEEVIYRGFLLTLLRTVLGLPAALLSQAFLFAFHHGAHRQGAALFLLRGAIGIGFGVLVFWRGNLLAAMAIHYLIDAAFALAPIQISSQETPTPAMRT